MTTKNEHLKVYQKIWRETHKDYMKVYLQKWREKHPDYFKKYYLKNKKQETISENKLEKLKENEKIQRRIYEKKYRRKNVTHLKEIHHKSYEKHKEARKEHSRQYYATHKEEIKEKNKKYNAEYYENYIRNYWEQQKQKKSLKQLNNKQRNYKMKHILTIKAHIWGNSNVKATVKVKAENKEEALRKFYNKHPFFAIDSISVKLVDEID